MKSIMHQIMLRRSMMKALMVAIMIVWLSGCTSLNRSFKNSAGILILASAHHEHNTHSHRHEENHDDEFDEGHYDRPANKGADHHRNTSAHSTNKKPVSRNNNAHDPLMVGFNFSQNSINQTFTANINLEYLYGSREFEHGTAVGVSLLADDLSNSDKRLDVFAGFEMSHKIAFNKPISPYVGVGLFGGDHEEDCTLTAVQIHLNEECPVEYIFNLYPEFGLQAWLGDAVRLQSFARYNMTTSDSNPMYWSYGFGFSVR